MVSVDEDGGQLKVGKPEQFLTSRFDERSPAFSPDGRWVAYESNASGKTEVYVRPFPPPASGQGGLWPISNGGGTFPVWSPNGRDLLYESGDQIMAVSYTVKPSFENDGVTFYQNHHNNRQPHNALEDRTPAAFDSLHPGSHREPSASRSSWPSRF